MFPLGDVCGHSVRVPRTPEKSDKTEEALHHPRSRGRLTERP